jgi:hypothetical protein
VCRDVRGYVLDASFHGDVSEVRCHANACCVMSEVGSACADICVIFDIACDVSRRNGDAILVDVIADAGVIVDRGC